MKILAIVHVFYPEFWSELAACLRNITDPLDVIVTYVDETKGIPELVHRDFPAARTLLTENRGFDIWPFLAALKTVNLADYDLIVKLHTKRDVHAPFDVVMNNRLYSGPNWRRFLLGFIRRRRDWEATRARFADPAVGIVADDRVIMTLSDTPWEVVRESSEKALAYMREVFHREVDPETPYVGGTMFAARAKGFALLMSRDWTVEDFPPTVRTEKEQFAHAMERVLAYSVAASGLRLVPCHGTLAASRRRARWLGVWKSFYPWFFEWRHYQDRLIVKLFRVSIYRGRKHRVAEKLSVVIPVYNAAPYIGKALDMLLSQTSTAWEAVCVDDGSTDGSAELLDRYAARDARIRVVHQKNAGSFIARKRGVALCTGDYVTFLDPDDSVQPGMTDKVLAFANRSDADMIQYGVSCFTDGECPPGFEQTYLDWARPKTSALGGSARILNAMFVKRLIPWSLIYHAYRTEIAKAAFAEMPEVEAVNCTDLTANFYLVQRCRTFRYLAAPLYRYRLGTGTSTRKVISLKEFRRRALSLELVKAMRARFPASAALASACDWVAGTLRVDIENRLASDADRREAERILAA